MSFFNDFLKYFGLNSLDFQTTMTNIIGYGVVIVGKINIKNISENEITFVSNKRKITITGNVLEIKSISKGEIVILGEIENTKVEKLW